MTVRMGYGVDLKSLSVHGYMEMLKKRDLLPGRRLLKENLEENIARIVAAGVHNLAELKSCLSSARRLYAFAEKTGIPEDHLMILKREMVSLEPKPVPVSDFPGVSTATVSAIMKKGIKTSKDVYDLAINPGSAPGLSRELGAQARELLELNCLCDLVRINGIGAAAARTLYEGGYRSTEAVARAEAADLIERMNAVNADRQYYKASLGVKDMQFAIDGAKMVLEAEEGK